MPRRLPLDPFHPVVSRVKLVWGSGGTAALILLLVAQGGWWSLLPVTGALSLLNEQLQRRFLLRVLTQGVITLGALVPFFLRYALHDRWDHGWWDWALVAVAALLAATSWWLFRPLRSLARRILRLTRASPGRGRGRSFAVILNPAKVQSVGGFEFLVRELAAETGWVNPLWLYTTPEETGAGLARKALESGAALVIVCGGDGTVREVCEVLAGSGVPMGIVPTGTGNLLARNLHLPMYMRSAIDTALTGHNQEIDMVAVSGDNMEPTHSMVMAGIGFDAAIMEGVNEKAKRRVGWMAYVASATRAIRYPLITVEVSVDGNPFVEHRVKTAVVGNAGTLQGGVQLLPDARLDDGLLDIVLLSPRNLAAWAPMAVRLLIRGDKNDDLVTRYQGRTVTIRSREPMPRELDGDLIANGHELTLTCEPRRVLVRTSRRG